MVCFCPYFPINIIQEAFFDKQSWQECRKIRFRFVQMKLILHWEGLGGENLLNKKKKSRSSDFDFALVI
jgi:hypothetical protein